MYRPPSKRTISALLTLIAAFSYSNITHAIDFNAQEIKLDPVILVGGSSVKFTLVTSDLCTATEDCGYPSGTNPTPDYRLHVGQVFTVALAKEGFADIQNTGQPFDEQGASYDPGTSGLVINRLVDSYNTITNKLLREVKASFVLNFDFDAKENQRFRFTLTHLEDLYPKYTDPNTPSVGALQVFNGTTWDQLPVGPEDALLTVRNGKPAWTKYYRIGDTGPFGGTVFYTSANGLHGLVAAPKVRLGDKSPFGAYEATKEGQVKIEPARYQPGKSVIWGKGCPGQVFTSANLDALGTGKINTLEILKSCVATTIPEKPTLVPILDQAGDTDSAAYLAASYFGAIRYRDHAGQAQECYDNQGNPDICWYLPSSGELIEMMKYASMLGLEGDLYWSSTQKFVIDAKGNQTATQAYAVGPNGQGSIVSEPRNKSEKHNVRAISAF